MKFAVRSFCLFLVFVMTLGLFGCQTPSQQPTQPTTNTTDPNVDPTDPTQGNPPIENLNEKTGLVAGLLRFYQLVPVRIWASSELPSRMTVFSSPVRLSFRASRARVNS